MTSKAGSERMLLGIVSIGVFVLFAYLMFLASVFAFMAVPFLMLLAFGAFFATDRSCSERVLFFLRAVVMAPVSVLGLFAPWRSLMIIANLNFPAVVTSLYPMLDKGNLYIPILETVAGVCGAVMAVIFGFRSLSTYIKFIRVIENLPRSMAGSAAVGLSEFSGKARSVTKTDFLLEDKSGRIKVELPAAKPWYPLDIFPLPDKTDFMKVFFTRRRGGDLQDGDPVYVVGSVEIEKGAAPQSEGSGRLVVRRSSEKEHKGIVKRFLFSEFEKHDIAEDYRNIFIATDRSESTARHLLRRAMFTSFGMTGLFLALSLSLIYIDRTQGAEVRDKILREIAGLVLKVPDETRPPWLPDFRTRPSHERIGAQPLVHLGFDDDAENSGSAQSVAPRLIEGTKEVTLSWREELYRRMFPVPLKPQGIFGQSMDFGGARHLEILDRPFPVSSGAYTVEFWFMLKGTGERQAPALEQLFSSDLFSLSIRDHGGEMVLQSPCFDKSGSIVRWSSHDLGIKRLLPDGLTPGLWYHFRAVHDGKMLDVGINGRVYIGIPRQIDREGMHCAKVPKEIREMKLGGSEPGQHDFVGRIDEFYLYDYAGEEKHQRVLFP